MRVLVTGAAGFVGGRVVRELMEHGRQVRATDIVDSSKLSCEFREADLTSLAAVKPLMAGVEAVCHLAAIKEPRPREEWPEVMRVNCLSSYHVLDAAEAAGVRKVALASSICAGGWLGGAEKIKPLYYPIDECHPTQPEEAYSLTKLLNEETARSFAVRFGMQVACLRLCEVFDVAQHGNTLPACDIIWTRVDVGDVAQAFRLAIERGRAGFSVYQVGSRYRYREDGRPESGAEVVEKVAAAGIAGIKDLDWAMRGGPIHSSRLAMEQLGYDPKY